MKTGLWGLILLTAALAFLAACRTPRPPRPELEPVHRVLLSPTFMAPTNFVLKPFSTRKDSGTELGDVLEKVTKPLQRDSTLWDRNADIREKVKPGETIAAVLQEQLPAQLARAASSRWSLVPPGEPADAELRVYVSELGFQDDAYASLFRTAIPRVTFQVALIATPTARTATAQDSSVQEQQPLVVLWYTNFIIARSSRWVALPGSSPDTFIRHPDYLRRSLEAISREGAERTAAEVKRALGP